MKVSQTLADKRRIERNIRGRGLIFRRLFRQVAIAQESRVLQGIPSISKPTLFNVMDREHEDRIIALAMRPFYIATLTDSASEIFKEFPEPELEFEKTIDPMDALDADIFKYANQYSIAMAKYVNKTTARKIKRIVREGLKERLHYSEITKNIKNRIFKDLREGVRARRLAHTEAHGMVENGRQRGARVNKVIKTKTWSSAVADARDTHKDANGQTVPKNEPYIVGGYRMMFPGDTSLGAGLEEIINCRCSSLFSSRPMKKPAIPKPEAPLTGKEGREKLMRVHKEQRAKMDKLIKENDDLYSRYLDLESKEPPPFRIEDRPAWREKLEELKVLNRAKNAELSNATDTFREELRRVLQVNPEGFTVKTQEIGVINRRQIFDQIKEFSKLIDEKIIPSAKARVGISQIEGRAFYDNRIINVIGRRTRVTIHELGHWLEDINPTIRRKVRSFYNKRTAGEVAKRLMDGYGISEITKKDKFVNKYMGRFYGGSVEDPTEILSMGLQYFYDDPVHLAIRDPEYFEFIFNVVRGL